MSDFQRSGDVAGSAGEGQGARAGCSGGVFTHLVFERGVQGGVRDRVILNQFTVTTLVHRLSVGRQPAVITALPAPVRIGNDINITALSQVAVGVFGI